jgi:hypothetical protein
MSSSTASTNSDASEETIDEVEADEFYSLTSYNSEKELVPPKCELILQLLGEKKAVNCRALIDTGTSRTIVDGWDKLDQAGIKLTSEKVVSWETKEGSFRTEDQAELVCTLPQFSLHRIITIKAHVDKRFAIPQSKYDVIIGRDVLSQLGFKIDFAEPPTFEWDDMRVQMRVENQVYVIGSKPTPKIILPAHYEKANLQQVVEAHPNLSSPDKAQLLQVLTSVPQIFDGTLGKVDMPPVHLELKPEAQPYNSRAFPIPQVHYETVKNDVDRLCQLGVLKKVPPGRWACPSFIVPKSNGTVRFITDFRQVNARIVRKPFPIPTIPELLHRLGGFTFMTSLDLSMGYYHMPMDAMSAEICTTVLPWGHFAYLRLPMGVSVAPDIFMWYTTGLFADLPYVLVYFDDILIYTKGSLIDHLQKLAIVLERIRLANLQVNAEKSHFAVVVVAYLGFILTREGVKPQPAKIEAIMKLAPPANVRGVRSLVGLVNFYREFIPARSETLSPLTELTKKGQKFLWGPAQQKAFEEIKRKLAREILLQFPDFNEPFIIHTDASKNQIGGVISQRGKPIAFYSKRLNSAQQNYTTIKLELLAIVEILRAYRNILLGHTIVIYTDHKNLSFDNFSSDQVRRWRLIVEEYGPEIIYIKGSDNIVADFLSRWPMLPDSTMEAEVENTNEEIFYFVRQPQGSRMSPRQFVQCFECFGPIMMRTTMIMSAPLPIMLFAIIKPTIIIYSSYLVSVINMKKRNSWTLN